MIWWSSASVEDPAFCELEVSDSYMGALVDAEHFIHKLEEQGRKPPSDLVIQIGINPQCRSGL